MIVAKWPSSYLAKKQLLWKESQDCTSDTYIQDLEYQRKLSQTEIPDLLQSLPKDYAIPSKYARISPQPTTHRPMDNWNEQISGWNNTYDSGATNDKMIGTHGFQ